ncbi:MAG: sigma-54-dependent Fis family transcriptional regulator [Xanthomonadales bacterium]|nr:sigma-54-dependent Fis family transcriptional regulator [Xanthomonadales bacterium]
MTARRRPRVLLADDQRDVLDALRILLKSEGIDAHCVDSPAAALSALDQQSFDAALIDLNYSRDTTSGREGMQLLQRLRDKVPELPVVVMTAWGSIELAVEAVRLGAGDFIEKPWENQRLLSVLRNQIALGESRAKSQRLDAANRLMTGADGESFIADAPAMQPVLELVERVAPSDANLLILGENGCGKGLLARHIHRLSRRADESLIKVNMGGIAESVFESEMFGHVRGAFTDAKADRIGRFELADGGTLFLDEIANIPLSQQPKLLRVLEDRELERLGSSRTLSVNVRILSATNADLQQDIRDGRFRKDLLFRLNTVEIRLPPLRERREDILPLARSFLVRHGQRYQREGIALDDSAERQLMRYDWPGNVRELSHVLERAVLMARHDRIGSDDLGIGGSSANRSAATTATPLPDMTLEQAEQMMIRNALDRCSGNIQHTADMLGLSRAALYRRLEKYGMEA